MSPSIPNSPDATASSLKWLGSNPPRRQPRPPRARLPGLAREILNLAGRGGWGGSALPPQGPRFWIFCPASPHPTGKGTFPFPIPAWRLGARTKVPSLRHPGLRASESAVLRVRRSPRERARQAPVSPRAPGETERRCPGREAARAAPPLQAACGTRDPQPQRLKAWGRAGKARKKFGAMRILPCVVGPEPDFEFIHDQVPSSPISGVAPRATDRVRSRLARPPSPALSSSDPGPSGPSEPFGLFCPALRASLPGPRGVAGAQLQTAWLPPGKAPGPDPGTTFGPVQSRLSGPQPRQPRVLPLRERLPRKPAGREGPAAAPGARPSPPSGPDAKPGRPQPSQRPPAPRKHASGSPSSAQRLGASGHPLGPGARSEGPGAGQAEPGATSVPRAQRRRPPRGAPPSFSPSLRATRSGQGSRREPQAPARKNRQRSAAESHVRRASPPRPWSPLPPLPRHPAPPRARRARRSHSSAPAPSAPACLPLREQKCHDLKQTNKK